MRTISFFYLYKYILMHSHTRNSQYVLIPQDAIDSHTHAHKHNAHMHKPTLTQNIHTCDLMHNLARFRHQNAIDDNTRKYACNRVYLTQSLLQGTFTRDFEMSEPGKSSITINAYRNRSLRTNKTYSKVHTDFDVDF